MRKGRHRTVDPDSADERPDAGGVSDVEGADEVEAADKPETIVAAHRVNRSRLLFHGVLPGLALVLAMTAGLLKWQDSSVRYADVARIESAQAAKEAAIAMLSYQPDTVEKDLGAARDRLVGGFRDSFSQLTRDVIIPGAQGQRISATAHVLSAGSVSATADHAVALLFVDQVVAVGDAAPTTTASSFLVTLDKIDGGWLISAFDPV